MSIGLTIVFSLKGGVGKTSIASALAWELEREKIEVPIITNDPISPLERVMGTDKAMVMKPKQDFPKALSTNEDAIIDLGGFVEGRIIHILKKAKNIIIPTFGDLYSIQGTISTIREVENHNQNIFIVVNKIGKHDFAEIAEYFRDVCPTYPLFPVKASKCFENMATQQKGISEMMDNEPLLRRAYREVHKQIMAIIKQLKE